MQTSKNTEWSKDCQKDGYRKDELFFAMGDLAVQVLPPFSGWEDGKIFA